MARAWMSLKVSTAAAAMIEDSTEQLESLYVDPISAWADTSIVVTMQ